MGVEYREEILKKIDKFREPASQKAVRTLPVPLDAPKKKRGGYNKFIVAIYTHPKVAGG